MSTSKPAETDLVAEIERRAQELDAAQERVDEYGETKLQELADAYRAWTEMLDRFQDQVTGDDGDIQTIVAFQSRIDEVMGKISADTLRYEIFEECDEYLQQKWFSDSDFEHVYEQLEPVGELVERLEDRNGAREAYRETRKELSFRCEELAAELDELERLAALSDADLDAPTERIREPIETYNEVVTEAFRELYREESARTVVAFLEEMEWYPLVEFEPPPSEIADYIRNDPPGTEPVPKLLEYGGYSRSKLSHYVDDPERLVHAVDHHRAYFDKLDADPLRIDWPPPTATELRWLCQELTSAVNRIDPSAVESLRVVRALPRETEYERLRNSAVVAEDLSEEERRRLKSGSVEDELEEVRAEYERLEAALSEFPER
ncbi:MAG: hypothetical protein V5A52_03135 [Halovenus sp.]|uniref:DUF7118 family protein n=1 Tax=Halovenus amylolytica TaxID=2500550 RepID=UPI000FE2B727